MSASTPGRRSTLTTSSSPSLEGLLGDVRVRRALSLAFDRTGLHRHRLRRRRADPTTVGRTPATWGFARGVFRRAWDRQPVRARRTSPRARRLIRAAGAKGKTLVIATCSGLASVATEANAWQAAGAEHRPATPSCTTSRPRTTSRCSPTRVRASRHRRVLHHHLRRLRRSRGARLDLRDTSPIPELRAATSNPRRHRRCFDAALARRPTRAAAPSSTSRPSG